MSVSAATQSTLMAQLWPVTKGPAALRVVLLALAGSALVAASAQIQVPLVPVPITGQTFGVLIVGMALGWRLGAASLALYMAEGTIGLPVFSNFAAGPAVILGPTGGYIVGFVLAAGIVGYLAERGWDRTIGLTALAMLIGNIAIYVPGLLWLASQIGVEKAIEFGLMPFLIGDALKLALAAGLFPVIWKRVGKPRV